MYPQERFAYHKRPFSLSFASKGLGYLAALLLLLLLLARYKLSCYHTTLLLTILALVDITLLKTTCHFLLLLAGFNTLTSRKELQLTPYTCGLSMTPYKLWFVNKPKLSFLKIWGCDAYVKKLRPDKLEPKVGEMRLHKIPK